MTVHPLQEETPHQALAQMLLCSAEHGAILCAPCNTRRNNLLAILDANDEETWGLTIPEGKPLVMFGAIAEIADGNDMPIAQLLKFCRDIKNTLNGPFDQVRVRIATPELETSL